MGTNELANTRTRKRTTTPRRVKRTARTARARRDLDTNPDDRVLRSAFKMLLDVVGVPTYVVSRQGKILFTNIAARRRLRSDLNLRDRLRDCTRGRVPEQFVTRPLRDSRRVLAFVIIEQNEPSQRPPTQNTGARLVLSDRERHVTEFVLRGYSNAAIAAHLGITERTVEAHMTSILRKANVHSRTALAAKIFGSN